MTPRKLNVGFATFPYAGNGATQSEHPSLRWWYLKTLPKLQYEDDRCEGVYWRDFCDTPITMTRNEAVEWGKQQGLDVLVMIDSDQYADYHYEQTGEGKPFFESSFDYLYDHYDKGPVVICAPYCGPPPARNVYVFNWENYTNWTIDDQFKMAPYSRREADMMAGIQDCGAGPTGLIMYDMRAFDLLSQPYFYYEWEGETTKCPTCHQQAMLVQDGLPQPGVRQRKCSTEDVTFTRDLAINGQLQLGYNPMKCNWDAWAGHVKSETVGKPLLFKHDQVSHKVNDAREHRRQDEQLVIVGSETERINERINDRFNGKPTAKVVSGQS